MSKKYQCLSKWRAHRGKILASAVTTYRSNQYYITGANDGDISVWSFNDEACSTQAKAERSEDLLFSTLADFVSYKTVSSRPEFAEDCRKGATFLGSLFKRLGGHVEMLSTETAHNPVVYAKFSGKRESGSRKRILFYGHYDVVAADDRNGKWATDPFTMKGSSGFLYGRGVTDNKGPIVAALYAVTDLMQAQKLDNDIIFLIEGEEEFGSRGFEEAVKRHKELIGEVEYILLANSYWLNDEVPCLTYGLRGVLHATVCVDSPRPDMHSGVDGSHLANEPLTDLTWVLSKLKSPRNKIQIPGFYDSVPAITREEDARFDDIASLMVQNQSVSMDKLKQSLLARWREPNLTIHQYKVSGPDGSLVSGHASSHLSMRLVPGQEVDSVAKALTWFLQREFERLESQNKLSVRIDNKAEPWLGDPTNELFRTVGTAIREAWPDSFDGDIKGPLYIREGGSIPAIRFLEKEFAAPAINVPCGRSSDAAHLDNERMSVVNLIKAREIFGNVFQRL